MLEAGYWMLDDVCWLLDAGCWILDAKRRKAKVTETKLKGVIYKVEGEG